MNDLRIQPMTPDDWPSVEEIYRAGIETKLATFESDVPTWAKWNAAHHPFARLVALDDVRIRGWAALAPVSSRQVYSGVAEVSVYVDTQFLGRGCGYILLDALIRESEKNNIWTLQASIFAENERSLKLHVKCGFREVGRRTRIAKLDGVWRDTVLLERRSTIVGAD